MTGAGLTTAGELPSSATILPKSEWQQQLHCIQQGERSCLCSSASAVGADMGGEQPTRS